jgi:hypothetical protein
MANVNDIVARLVLNAKAFTAGFDQVVNDATVKAKAGGAQIGRAFSDQAGQGLRNFAGEVPVVGSALTGLSGVALTAAAGIGAVSLAAGAALANTEEYTVAARQLEAVLRATGNTTGFTTDQLKEFAEAQESAWAISAEAILKAEQVLSSFDGVAGTTFKRAISLSADMAAVWGGDLSGNAEKLGMVLQNLAQGNVEGLSKGFRNLGKTTLESIEALAKSGQTAEAQTALLDALASKIGGTAEGAAQGTLTGAFFRLKDAIGDASRAFAEQSGLYDSAVSGVNSLTSAIDGYTAKLREMNGTELSAKALQLLAFLANPAGNAGLLFGSGAPDINVAAGNSAGFGGFTGRSTVTEDASAKAAADRAKAEGDRARASEAAAAAAKKHADESERATKAIAKQRADLAQSIEDLEFQAKTAGMSRTEAEKLGTLRRLELQYGRLLSDNDRQRIANAIELRQRTEEAVSARRREIDDFVSGNGSLLPGLMEGSLKPGDLGALLGLKTGGSAGATEAGQNFRYLSDAFYDAFSGRAENIWSKFTDLGTRSISELAAQLVTTGKFDFGSTGLGGLLGGGAGGIAGAVLGIGLPLIGGIINSIGPTSRGFANLRTDASGRIVTNNMQRGREGDAAQANASAAAQQFLSSLTGLASQFGGSIAGGVDLGAIGFSKGTFQLKSTQLSKGAYGGGTTTRFNTAEEVVAAALQQALSRGAITGLDAGIQKLLSGGDLGAQTAKAQLLASALKEFNTSANPLQAAVDDLNDQFAELRDVMIEAGSSTEDMAKASALYDKKLQEIQKSSEQAITGLRDFLNDLNFGSSSPLALGDQRAAALANYNSLVSGIGSAGFDQSAFVAAGRRLLDIETQISGRTQDFFSIFNQVQADTNRAITGIQNANSIAGENPFARATADATAATANNTAELLGKIDNLSALLLQTLTGSGSFIGSGRAFVADYATRVA